MNKNAAPVLARGITSVTRGALPPADAVALERRRIFILPTRNGLLFGAVVLAMLVGAVNYDNNLAYLFTFLLASVSVVSILHTYHNLRRLTLTRGKPRPVFFGDPVRFTIGIDNQQPYPRFALHLRDEHGAETMTDQGSNERGWAHLERHSCSRGRHALGPVTLSTCYPLGLFRAWTRVHLNESTIVYPKPAERGPLPPTVAVPGAGTSDAGNGTSGDFSGLRPYHLGDPMRHIAWKSVARGREMLTKQFSEEAADELRLEWTQTPPGDIEKRLSLLCRWVLDAEAAGQRYGLTLPGQQIAPDRGAHHQTRCLTALALFGREAHG